ncbi:MAG: hypothetical protein JWP98_1318 [Edaphobacter sp.]|nr:hypothetical protein [Edaphobacter sp.]
MATDAIFAPASGLQPTYRPVNRTVERVFYSGMAILLCVCVFIGFSPTYFQAGMMRAPLPSPILHIHGAVFTLWMLLFVVQAALISARRVKWHRSFGTVAFCLPPIMIVLGVIAAIDALHRGVKIGPLDPAVSAAIPLIGIVGFTIVIYASWRARRRPDAHKRLILIATMGLVAAASAAFPGLASGFRPPLEPSPASASCFSFSSSTNSSLSAASTAPPCGPRRLSSRPSPSPSPSE